MLSSVFPACVRLRGAWYVCKRVFLFCCVPLMVYLCYECVFADQHKLYH